MQTYNSQIPAHRASRAQELAGIVREHLDGAMLVTAALEEIREDKLYVELGYKTWNAYSEGELGVSRRRANQTIQEQRLRQIMAPNGPKVGNAVPSAFPTNKREAPLSGRVVRELAPLIAADPVAAREVISEVQATGPVTEQAVREVVERRTPVVAVPERWSPPRHDERFRFPRMALELLSALNGPPAREGAELLRQSRHNADETADLLISLRNRLEEYIDLLQRED